MAADSLIQGNGPFDPNARFGELAPCSDYDCACPLTCKQDATLATVLTQTACERPCVHDFDCPNPLTVCQTGFCQLDLSGSNLLTGAFCLDISDGPGTSVAVQVSSSNQAPSQGAGGYNINATLCRRAGDGGGTCDPTRTFCPLGEDCLPQLGGDGGWLCQPVCDEVGVISLGLDAGWCGPDRTCVLSQNFGYFEEGICAPGDAGQCQPDLPFNEDTLCYGNSDCACGLNCAADPSGNPSSCQRPCQGNADCPYVDQACRNGYCRLNFCGTDNYGYGVGSSYGYPCDADGIASGTCFSYSAASDPFLDLPLYHSQPPYQLQLPAQQFFGPPFGLLLSRWHLHHHLQSTAAPQRGPRNPLRARPQLWHPGALWLAMPGCWRARPRLPSARMLGWRSLHGFAGHYRRSGSVPMRILESACRFPTTSITTERQMTTMNGLAGVGRLRAFSDTYFRRPLESGWQRRSNPLRWVSGISLMAFLACGTTPATTAGTTSGGAGPSTSASVGAASSGQSSGDGAATSGTAGLSSASSAGSSASSGGGPATPTSGSAPDAGCQRSGNLPPFNACGSSDECQCGLDCLPLRGDGGLQCLQGCGPTAPCSIPGLDCIEHECVLPPSCRQAGRGGASQQEACTNNDDCVCPLGCTVNGNDKHGTCQLSCRAQGDCDSTGQQCPIDQDGGALFCQGNPSCSKSAGAAQEEGCVTSAGCACPLSCVRGQCQLTCGQSDCDNASVCESDAGVCVPFCNPASASAGEVFAACLLSSPSVPQLCRCPLRCVRDLSIDPSGQRGACEDCTSGTCQSIPGACQASADDGGAPEGNACLSNADCVCPNSCRLGRQGTPTCEPPFNSCHSAADCPLPWQTCQIENGVCLDNYCDALTGPAGTIGLPCDTANGQQSPPLHGDGTCLFVYPPGGLVCVRAGSGPQCDTNPALNGYGAPCPVGQVCLKDSAIDAGFCLPACDPAASPPTSDGGLNACSGPNQTCNGSQICSTSETPTSCISNLPAGAASAAGFGNFASCQGDNNCACPLACAVAEPVFGLKACESRCSSDNDCPFLSTECGAAGTTCTQSSACATLAGPCQTARGSAGTCVPAPPVTQLPLYCQRAGDGGDACDPRTTACPLGQDCLAKVDGGTSCQPICDARAQALGKPSGCTSGTACVLQTYTTGEGLCETLNDAGCWPGLPSNEFAPCGSNSDCSCELSCEVDPNLSQSLPVVSPPRYCERPCASSGQCRLDEVCVSARNGNFCQLNFCFHAANSALLPDQFGAPCDADTVQGRHL